MTTRIWGAVAMAAVLAAASPPPQADRAVETVQLLQREDLRVAEVGWRLLTANRELCVRQAPLSGLVLYDAAQFAPGYRAAAARLYGVGEPISVGAVVPGSAGARAGLAIGDAITAVNGTPLAIQKPGRAAVFDGVERAVATIDRAMEQGDVTLTVARDGAERTVTLAGDSACASFVQLIPSDERNAYADGRIVTVTTGAVAFAQSPDELAALVAHETAHNILRHRARLDAAGVSRGLLQGFGRDGRLTRAAEAEADRLSIYLLARAGFDPRAALTFWERFGRATQQLFPDGTHHGWRTRVAAMEAEIARLPAKGEPIPVPGDLPIPRN